MTIWRNSKMTCLYFTAEDSSENYPCIVEVNDEEIIIKYDDVIAVKYSGKNNGTGHFELISTEVRGKATLHRMSPDSPILEGYWVEEDVRGMWRITLID